MTLITSPVPEIGVAVASEQVDTTNILTEIKNLLNGGVEADNLTTALRAAVSPPVVTTLPASPSDGDRVRVHPAPGVLWTFRYNAAIVDAYRWEAEGAGCLYSDQYSTGTPAGTTQLGSVTVPFAGYYDVSAWAEFHEADPAGAAQLLLRSGATVVAPLAYIRNGNLTPGASLNSVPREALLSSPGTFNLAVYRAGSGSVYNSRLAVAPRRVG